MTSTAVEELESGPATSSHIADDRRDDNETWPLLPAILAVLGAVTGFSAHLILQASPGALGGIELASLSFIIVAAMSFGFVVRRDDPSRSIAFALGAGVVAALILFFSGSTANWGDSEGWRVVCLGIALFIAAPLFQSGRDMGFRNASYPSVYNHAWSNAVLWCLGWAFVAVTFALSWLLASLFQLIGIKLFSDLLSEPWLWRTLLGLFFGLGLALLRQQRRIVGLMQNVAMLVLGVLPPVLAFGLAMFLLALPFTGLTPLWETNLSSTGILLSCSVSALLLLNAVIGNGSDHEQRNMVLRHAALVLAIVILPLVILAAVAAGLRINQYGFTPARLWSLTFVIVAAIVGVTYIIGVIRGRRNWAAYIRPSNLHLAVVICGITLLLATPLLSFNAISTRDQIARLQNGKVTVEQFDWRALAFDFGKPGRDALGALSKAADPKLRKKAVEVLAAKSKYDVLTPEAAQQRDAFEKLLTIRPNGTVLSKDLLGLVRLNAVCSHKACTLIFLSEGRQAVLVEDDCVTINSDKESQKCSGSKPSFYEMKGGEWREGQLAASKAEGPAAEQLARGFKTGDIEVRNVERRQIYIGGQPIGAPFD